MNIAAHIAFTNENKPWMDIFLAIYAGGVVEKKKGSKQTFNIFWHYLF